MSDLFYNVLLLCADVLWFRALRSGQAARTAWSMATVIVVAGAGAVAAAWAFGENGFALLRFWCYAAFLHGPLLAAGTAILRRERRIVAAAGWAAALALVIVAIDAFAIEPHWLDVTTYHIQSPKITHAIRIAVLADFQIDRVGDYERDVIRRVVAAKPDLILMPGDYLQIYNPRLVPADRRIAVEEGFRALLKESGFAAPLGVYAVRGNVEHDGWERTTFAGLPITATDRTQDYDVGGDAGNKVVGDASNRVGGDAGDRVGGDPLRDPPRLRITLLSFADSFNPHLHVDPADRFHIVVGHGPDFALGDVQADLLVAGHTHGGQVQLPFIGPLMTLSSVPRRWAAGGLTELGSGRELIVSRGTGLERGYAPRLRFLCRPQLVFVELGAGEP